MRGPSPSLFAVDNRLSAGRVLAHSHAAAGSEGCLLAEGRRARPLGVAGEGWGRGVGRAEGRGWIGLTKTRAHDIHASIAPFLCLLHTAMDIRANSRLLMRPSLLRSRRSHICLISRSDLCCARSPVSSSAGVSVPSWSTSNPENSSSFLLSVRRHQSSASQQQKRWAGIRAWAGIGALTLLEEAADQDRVAVLGIAAVVLHGRVAGGVLKLEVSAVAAELFGWRQLILG